MSEKQGLMQLRGHGHVYDVRLRVSRYKNNDSLYVGLECLDDGDFRPNITVNLGQPFGELPRNFAFVDTNNFSEAEAFLEKYGIAEPAGESKRSGYCTYPLYEFNEEKLQELCPEDWAEYVSIFETKPLPRKQPSGNNRDGDFVDLADVLSEELGLGE